MERRMSHAWNRALVLVCLVGLIPTGGCAAAALAMYAIKGTNVPGEYEELKDQRVCVVCRPTASLQYSNASVSKRLARLVSVLLDQNIRKLHVIDVREVEQWTDENSWNEYHEVGQALKADLVIGIDLENFELYQGQTLYQGRASLTVSVNDVEKPGTVHFEKVLPQVIFPPNSGIPASDRPEAEFRAQFLNRVANQVGNLFYSHDSRADFALDSLAL